MDSAIPLEYPPFSVPNFSSFFYLTHTLATFPSFHVSKLFYLPSRPLPPSILSFPIHSFLSAQPSSLLFPSSSPPILISSPSLLSILYYYTPPPLSLSPPLSSPSIPSFFLSLFLSFFLSFFLTSFLTSFPSSFHFS